MPMGDGGLVVTVPRIWVRFHQLKVGDKLDIKMDSNGELHVYPTRLPVPLEDSDDED